MWVDRAHSERMAAYPNADPVAKHDILCPASILQVIRRTTPKQQEQQAIIHDIDSLITSMNESAASSSSIPSSSNDVIKKVATVYTYPDAPTQPNDTPLSRAPRIYKLVTRTLMNQWITTTSSNSSTPLHKCTIGVKLPSRIPPDDTVSQSNTSSFRDMVQSLCEMKVVTMLACDSSGRIGFLVPNDNNISSSNYNDNDIHRNGINDNDNYAAYIYYASMNEFISWLQSTAITTTTTTHSPETWTPQYTPPHEEEECISCGWDDDDNSKNNNDPSTWTPQYTPPPEEECYPSNFWNDAIVNNTCTMKLDSNSKNNTNDDNSSCTTAGLFVPTANETTTIDDGIGAGLWGWDSNRDEMNTANESDVNGGWDMLWNNNNNNSNNNNHHAIADANGDVTKAQQSFSAIVADNSTTPFEQRQQHHADSGAAAADAFYSGLTRSLDTRADSRLFHMRNFNGWIKATMIAELDPDTSSTSRGGSGVIGGKKRSRTSPLRVLDLACGKGGDLGKWTIHHRKIENYVGIDVARGSLVDAAKRARQMCNKKNSSSLRKCTFTLADLGEDRLAIGMQKLPTWSLQTESSDEGNSEPIFVPKEGGGIAETDKFDVVSIQFAIHYMMSTRKRARRFFHTVSSLLEIGGNLIATTIDARVVIEKLMGLGIDYHFDDMDVHADVNTSNSEADSVTVSVGQGVCKLKFETDTLRKLFQHPGGKSLDDMLFGLQYTFTLVEGSDHAAGVGEAVDLPEWLTPIAALEELAKESGLKLEYVSRW